MIIELKGGQFANVGAHLMVCETLRRLGDALPGVMFAMYPTPLADPVSRKRYAIKTLLPMRKGNIDLVPLAYHVPSPIRSMLGQLGWVTEPDVCGVVDLSGFVYGAQWGDYSMRRAAAEIKRFGKFKQPYVFLPQAFGPFENTRGASEFGAALSRAALIYARDHRSKANLDALMPAGAPSVSVMPDMTMAASSDFALANRLSIDAKTAVVVPNSRVVSQGVADESRYIQFLVASAE